MEENYYYILGIFFVAALGFSLIINRILLKFVKTLGIRNQQGTVIRWSASSKPALGGISFYIIFLFSIIMYPFEREVSGCFIHPQTLGIFAASTIGFLLGLFDDAYNTKPWLKFFSQVACGVVLIATGIYIKIFDNEILNYTISIFWVVGIMNAINLLDNMDAISAIVSIGILLGIIAMLIFSSELNHKMAFLIIGVLAALIGFLFYNWHPSKMYMGDTGSQFLGVFLAGIGIVFLWNGPNSEGESSSWMQVTGVLMAFALPIIDTTTVFIKRILKGGSPFVGGKDHTTHHLGYLGLKDNHVAMVFALLSIIFSGLAFVIFEFITFTNLKSLFYFWGFFLIVFISMFIIANKNKHLN
ncbi:MAG: undecaprenyl/decaprenyl-phosphate alpha-N-acetylglucosaminyl 1-phosphate transferase [Bacteroidetes bacterium]|nr:undecaprenyl/decaprenyl-phosphate alpha-N-acetylglucosaminyl 1-phosphate transferase [Bacteroidota bacterium]